jgi:hypothetical protein
MRTKITEGGGARRITIKKIQAAPSVVTLLNKMTGY